MACALLRKQERKLSELSQENDSFYFLIDNFSFLIFLFLLNKSLLDKNAEIESRLHCSDLNAYHCIIARGWKRHVCVSVPKECM